MTLSTRLRAACAVGAVLALAACTSTPTDGPTATSASTTPSASVVDPSTAPPPSPTSPTASADGSSAATAGALDPVAQEAADRAAIEAQWVKFWDVYQEIVRTSPSERQSLAASVAVPSLAQKLVTAAEKAAAEHKDNYGSIAHHMFWQFDVAGQSTAVIADCQDQSKAGTIEVDTAKILTTGEDHTNLRGRMQKGSDGVWRVGEVISLNETEC